MFANFFKTSAMQYANAANNGGYSFFGAFNGQNQQYNQQLQQQAAEQQQAFQTLSAERAMQFSAEEALKNRDWQEKMSNTAYRRAVDDLKNAGLNPILAAFNQGASTPSGGAASGFAQSGSKADVDTYNQMFAALGSIYAGLNSASSLFTSALESARGT